MSLIPLHSQCNLWLNEELVGKTKKISLILIMLRMALIHFQNSFKMLEIVGKIPTLSVIQASHSSVVIHVVSFVTRKQNQEKIEIPYVLGSKKNENFCCGNSLQI